jgi:hypothetical protein
MEAGDEPAADQSDAQPLCHDILTSTDNCAAGEKHKRCFERLRVFGESRLE